jgi:hypothetical protein
VVDCGWRRLSSRRGLLDHCSPRSAHHWSLTKSLSIVSCLFSFLSCTLSSTLRPKTREMGDGRGAWAGLAPPLIASHWCPTLWTFGSRGGSFCPPCRGWGDVETSGPANLCVYARGLDLDRSFHRRQRANGVACWFYRPGILSRLFHTQKLPLLSFFFSFLVY